MENWSYKICKSILIIVLLSTIAEAHIDCKKYQSFFASVRATVERTGASNLNLEQSGFVIPDNVFGDAPSYDQCTLANQDNANLHTIGAQAFQAKFKKPLSEFQSIATECNFFQSTPCAIDKPKKLPKYRAINGRGNNKDHPEWGGSGTPFVRYADRNFADGIYTPPKSVLGGDLPSPRSLVQKVLLKAVTAEPPPLVYNVFTALSILFVTHDVQYQIPVQPHNVEKEILCCSNGIVGVSALSPSDTNSACYPLEIDEDDSFYSAANITCLSMVRSSLGEKSGQVQSGEIMNHATAWMDISLVYGNQDSETASVRNFTDGKFRMGPNNLLPVGPDGKYIPSMARFTNIPVACMWPALFAKNHNHLAEELAKINPCWDDETLFQEARRINIANIQYNFVTSGLIQGALNGIPINETYSGIDPSVTIEFAIAYRGTHFYNYDWISFLSENGTTTQVTQSDSVGHIEIMENGFDDAMRSSIREIANVRSYSQELINKIGKNSAGFGVDLIATDIQRSREYGCPSYLEIRRRCNLQPDFKTFEDFKLVMNETNVALLESIYASPEDVDFYVGGVLEIFKIVGGPFVGPSFGCLIAAGHDSFAGGDIYYYSNPSSPYPFPPDQINSVHNYNLSSIICQNTGLTEVVQIWPFQLNNITNPLVQCSDIPDIDLSPWKDATCAKM